MTAEFAPRLDIQAVESAAYKPMYALEKYIHATDLGEDLLALVKTRASQLNQCAYCLDMHAGEGRNAGVPQRKLDVLAGWHEAPGLYTPRERAALAFTEEVTLISEGGVSDKTWTAVRDQFSEQESVQLLMAICAINSWNRMAISMRQSLPDA